MKNRYVHYGLVLMLIASISAGILSLINSVTLPAINRNKIEVTNKARVMVLPEAITFYENQKVATTDGLEFIPGTNEAGEVVGYVVEVSQGGYAANIEFVLGVGIDGKVTGLSITGSQETPGLGSKIMNPEWQKKAIGKDESYKFNKATDGFAGATISPNAVYTGIKRVLTTYNKEVKK